MTKLLLLVRLRRLLVILWVVSRYRLDALASDAQLPFAAKLLLWVGPWRLTPSGAKTRGERLRLALEALGPIFIKFGQVLSTRRDLLPDDIADELQKLQDQVPPFPGAQAKEIIEQSLGAPTEKLFSEFNTEPLASASVAQVHAATLRNGKQVVVKVTRPNILPTIKQDIHVLFFFAALLEKFWSEGKRLHPVEVVRDYERTIHDELDLQREAANCSQLRRNFLNSELIYIPEIYWDYCHQHVLVMERISGIPVADVRQLKSKQTNMKLLAERGVEIFFTQVFRDSFFHADMHPGNIFVSHNHLESPQYIAVDFGIVGTLSPEDQNYLARNLLAFFKRDYRLVAQLHIDSGWVPEGTRVDEFESAIRTVCEPIFEKPLKDISFAQFLLRLFQTARRFNMEVQPQLVLLQKTLLNIEGLGRQLYPDLDLWNTAQPYLETWMRNRIAPPGLLNSIKQQFPDWVEQSPEIPQLVFDALTKIKHLESTVTTPTGAQNATEMSKPRKSGRKWVLGALAIAAGALYAQPEAIQHALDLPWQSLALFAFGAILWLS